MKFSKVFFLIIMMSAINCGSAAPRSVVKPPLDISFNFDGNSITLHEPLILQFKVHNGLESPIALNLGMNTIQFFDFVLTSPQGEIISGRQQSSWGLNSQPGKLVIAPGEDYHQELLLNRWFDFSSAGRYFLTARLNTAIDIDGSSVATSPVTNLDFEIGPRDTSRLTKVCSDLFQQISSANGVEAGQEPALKLSYINDPVAVPYLRDVLMHHYFDYHIAIEGLERIGNDAAIEALLLGQNDNYSDVADLARQSLSRMQGRISNPKLLDAVKRALATSKPRG
jgi:hypothetical protein